MFKLDLKKAEVAIQAGRLEDAFLLLKGTKQIEHASGQKLVDRLIEALVNRGQQHFELDHFA